MAESHGIAAVSQMGFGGGAEVPAAEGFVAERVGFEPTVPVKVHLISNQARSTGLRHLSAGRGI